MAKKDKEGKTRGIKYLSPIMISYVLILIASIVETIVLSTAKETAIATIVTMVIFDIIIAIIAITAITTIYERNKENYNNRHPSGKSRTALNITGCLLIALAIKTIVITITFLR